MTPCSYCGGSGICGSAPDAYFDCPECDAEEVNLDDIRDDRTNLNGDSQWT